MVEKHGTKTRRAWRQLHIGVDAGTGQIVASALTAKDVDDGAQVGPLPPRSKWASVLPSRRDATGPLA